MKSVGSISILHVIFLSMTVIGLKNHVTIIPPLLDVAKRDGWLSVLFAGGGIVFFWLFLIVYIQSKSNQEPSEIGLNQKSGKLALLLLFIQLLFFNDYRCFYNG